MDEVEAVGHRRLGGGVIGLAFASPVSGQFGALPSSAW